MSGIEIGKMVVVIFLILGALINVVGALGIVRLPDVYMRSHASTKSVTMGVLFILTGAIIFFWVDMGKLSVALLLALIFVFITAPIAGHLIGRAAYRSGVQLSSMSTHDDLKERLQRPEHIEK